MKHSLKKNQKCLRCKGPIGPKRVEHPYWSGHTLVAVVQDVPAFVCELCGFHYFDPAVEITMRHLVKDYVKIGTLFPIPTTPYRELKGVTDAS